MGFLMNKQISGCVFQHTHLFVSSIYQRSGTTTLLFPFFIASRQVPLMKVGGCFLGGEPTGQKRKCAP